MTTRFPLRNLKTALRLGQAPLSKRTKHLNCDFFKKATF
jgi:hypothetical protein